MVVVITGTGRSGTSLMGAVYEEIGHDIGGSFSEENAAGFELPEAVELNQEILTFLGMTSFGRPGPRRRLADVVGDPVARKVKTILSTDTRRATRSAINRLPWVAARNPALMPWDLLDAAAERFKEPIGAAFAERSVVKDPLFLWTLPVWLRAGAHVTDIILMRRDLQQSMASHRHAGHMRFQYPSDARNSLVYGLGVVADVCNEYGITLTQVNFPQQFDNARDLYEILPLVDTIPFTTFERALRQRYRPELVHEYRAMEH